MQVEVVVEDGKEQECVECEKTHRRLTHPAFKYLQTKSRSDIHEYLVQYASDESDEIFMNI